MARIVALLLIFGYGSCMETRETVERTVMVRTTGSDLQPAATGFIFKKESDGPASVIKMGESEVIEHFSKLYGKPEAYTAPVPAPDGPFHAKEDEDKAASYTNEEQVKPVVENGEHGHDPIDGIANEDYDKIFEEYSKQFGRDKDDDFADYLHGLGHFDHDVHHGFGAGKDYDNDGYPGYGNKGYGKGNAGDYHSEKHEGFSVSKEGGHKKAYDDAHGHGKRYGHGYAGDDYGHRDGYAKGHEGFQKGYDGDEYKKGHDFYGGGAHKGGYRGYADGYRHGSGAGGLNDGGSHETGHYGFGKGGFDENVSGDDHDSGHASGDELPTHHDGNFAAKNDEYNGKSYGFEIKH